MSTDDLLADLTPAQREAVTHYEGPLLLLAGAGSGKTRVITRRIAWLLHQGVKPWNILAITFTNKAAGEMKQRVEALVPGSKVLMSTFHSFGARMLRQYADRLGIDRNFTIYDQADRAKVAKAALEDAGIDNNRFTPESVAAAISKAKNQLLGPERYAEKHGDFFGMTVAQVYPRYEKRLRDANAFDFDDLLYWPALALKNDAELRAELDERFRFVLIDEYQDTNQTQYAIARGLNVDHPNLCVVGDPDQSIYGWRGANIRNILDFERDFPGARVLPLTKNYRSTKAILHAASHLIAHNRQRKPKDLDTDNAAGHPVSVLTFDHGIAEAAGIAERIRKAVAGGKRSYRDFAIFVRINALTRVLEQVFVKERVPFQIVKGLAFFDRKENKDVLAYLRLLLNPRDDVSFQRVVNEPARGIGKVSLAHLQEYAGPRELSLLAACAEVDRIPAIKGKAATGLRAFAALVYELGKQAEAPAHEIIREVIERTGYRRMLLESHQDDDEDRLANIEEFITAARQFVEEDSSRTLGDFLENITLASDQDGWDEKQDCVSVMTMHAAKGLEFPVVFLLAVEQGILPHERSLGGKTEEVEEERRLAFVGMTRAKEELYLCHSRMREYRGQTLYGVPSMFLSELPVEEIDQSGGPLGSGPAFEQWRYGGGSSAREGWTAAGVRPAAEPIAPVLVAEGDYATGMNVRHEKYGVGRVTDVSGHGIARRIKVRFRTAGEKTFAGKKIALEVVESR